LIHEFNCKRVTGASDGRSAGGGDAIGASGTGNFNESPETG
jgi:hypothetical protein